MAPLRLVHAGIVKLVCCNVIEFHSIIDILFGLDYQYTHSCVFDPSNFRVYDRLAKETIHLDYIGNVKAGLLSPPISFLSLCDGIATPYGMALNLGLRVHKYFAFEKYELVRAVTKEIYPDIIHLDHLDFLLVDDFSKIIALLRDANITSLAFVFGLPCTFWSRLSDRPKSFNHPLAQLVIKGAALLEALRQENMIWTV